MIGRKLSNFAILHEVGPFLKSAHIMYVHCVGDITLDWLVGPVCRDENKKSLIEGQMAGYVTV